MYERYAPAEEMTPEIRKQWDREIANCYPKVLSYLTNLCHSRKFNVVAAAEEAEDAMQEAMVKAYRFWYKYDPTKRSFSSWLCLLGIHYLYDKSRKERNQNVTSDEAILNTVLDNKHQREVQDGIRFADFMECLASCERNIVDRRLQDESVVDIAEDLGVQPEVIYDTLRTLYDDVLKTF